MRHKCKSVAPEAVFPQPLESHLTERDCVAETVCRGTRQNYAPNTSSLRSGREEMSVNRDVTESRNC